MMRSPDNLRKHRIIELSEKPVHHSTGSSVEDTIRIPVELVITTLFLPSQSGKGILNSSRLCVFRRDGETSLVPAWRLPPGIEVQSEGPFHYLCLHRHGIERFQDDISENIQSEGCPDGHDGDSIIRFFRQPSEYR